MTSKPDRGHTTKSTLSVYDSMPIDADFTIEVGRAVPSASDTVPAEACAIMSECLLTNDCARKLPDPPESMRNTAG